MDGRRLRWSLIQEILRAFHFVGRSVDEQQESAVFYFGLVLHDAVIRNADARESAAEGTDPAYDGGAFESADDPPDERSGHEQRTNARHPEERGAEQQPPEAAPKGS